MLRFETAGESHGQCLVATLTGLPAGVPVSLAAVNRELWRRQQGFGRGGRMKIETDEVEIVAGVRHSRTIGSPIALLIRNQDWQNWAEALPVEDSEAGAANRSPSPVRGRDTPTWPGRSSTISTMPATFWSAPARGKPRREWPPGAIAKAFLGEFGIQVLSHVVAVGSVKLERSAGWEELVALSARPEILLGCVDPDRRRPP